MTAETGRVLLDLLVVFATARIAGEVFERLRLPAVAGEVLAGMLIGPSVLGWARPSPALSTVALLGVVVLQFAVGLETRPSGLLAVGRRAALVAVAGVAVSIAGGYLFASAFGWSRAAALLAGVAIASTSVGVTARVLKERGLLARIEARVVLGAAVLDDMLGPLVLAVALTLADGRGGVSKALVVLAEIVAFVAFELWVAPHIVARHAHVVERLRIPNAPFVVAVTVMLATAALAEAAGLAAVVGGFLAGMALAETGDRFALARDVRPLYDWLVPYFFAVTGMQVRLQMLADPRVLALAVGLALVAIVAKLVACGAAAAGLGLRGALAVGAGMTPRAEIGLIVAAVGLAAGLIDRTAYAVLASATVLTLLASPFLIAPAFDAAAKGRPAA